MADLLIRKVKIREDKKWQPQNHDGFVSWYRDILDVDLTSGEWLILARTNYLVNKVCLRLKEDGHLFWREGTGWSISPNVLNAIEVWLKLCKGEELTSEELLPFSKLIHPDLITKAGQKTSSLFRIRSKLYSSRYYKQLQSKSDIRNTLAESSESIGTRGGIHSICQKERGEDTNESSEDPCIDNTQSQRWRGG